MASRTNRAQNAMWNNKLAHQTEVLEEQIKQEVVCHNPFDNGNEDDKDNSDNHDDNKPVLFQH